MTGVQYVSGTIDGTDKSNDPILGYNRNGGFQSAHLGSSDGELMRVGYYRAADTVSFRMKVPVETAAEAVTSAHIATLDGTGGVQAKETMWGNGLSNALEPIVDLECAACHNPHGNNQYRILNNFRTTDQIVTATPVTISDVKASTNRFFTTEAHSLIVGDIVTISGVTGAAPIVNGNQYIVKAIAGNTFTVALAPTKTTADITGSVLDITSDGTGGTVKRWAAIVDDAPLPTAGDTRNYTVLQVRGTQGTDSSYLLYESDVLDGGYSSTAGDYFHRTVPWNPAVVNPTANCNTANPAPSTGCETANDAPNGRPATVTTAGAGAVSYNDQISAWCSTCHTRYYSSTNTNPGIFDGNPAELEPSSSAASAKNIASAAGNDILSPVGSTNSFGYAVGDIVEFSGDAGNQYYVVYYATTGSSTTQTSTMRVSTTLDGAPVTAPASTGTVIRLYPFSASSWYFPRNGDDDTYKFQHQTTTNRACTTCHVGHGSDAQMTTGLTSFSADMEYPDGTPATAGYNSRLLKIDNRGTCQACHDPTLTATAGTQLGNQATPTVP